MKRTRFTKPRNDDAPAKLAGKIGELHGYFELGMAKESLQIARALLSHRPVHPVVVKEAVCAILVHADSSRTWRRSVEKAYAQAGSRCKNAIRSEMLQFYYSVHDFELAGRFVSSCPADITDIFFSILTLLELRTPDRAKPLCRRCRQLLEQPQDRFFYGMLLDGLGEYHAHIGDWDAAERYWRSAPKEEPFFASAARGLVGIQAARGHCFAAAGQKAFQELKIAPIGDLDLVVPGNEASRISSACKDLRRYSAALCRIVPEKELWRFGVRTPQ
jgi:hypothetical protein